jgi:hypothetical protein
MDNAGFYVHPTKGVPKRSCTHCKYQSVICSRRLQYSVAETIDHTLSYMHYMYIGMERNDEMILKTKRKE